MFRRPPFRRGKAYAAQGCLAGGVIGRQAGEHPITAQRGVILGEHSFDTVARTSAQALQLKGRGSQQIRRDIKRMGTHGPNRSRETRGNRITGVNP